MVLCKLNPYRAEGWTELKSDLNASMRSHKAEPRPCGQGESRAGLFCTTWGALDLTLLAHVPGGGMGAI